MYCTFSACALRPSCCFPDHSCPRARLHLLHLLGGSRRTRCRRPHRRAQGTAGAGCAQEGMVAAAGSAGGAGEGSLEEGGDRGRCKSCCCCCPWMTRRGLYRRSDLRLLLLLLLGYLPHRHLRRLHQHCCWAGKGCCGRAVRLCALAAARWKGWSYHRHRSCHHFGHHHQRPVQVLKENDLILNYHIIKTMGSFNSTDFKQYLPATFSDERFPLASVLRAPPPLSAPLFFAASFIASSSVT